MGDARGEVGFILILAALGLYGVPGHSVGEQWLLSSCGAPASHLEWLLLLWAGLAAQQHRIFLD